MIHRQLVGEKTRGTCSEQHRAKKDERERPYCSGT
jgi:hypothetical protein